MTETTGQMMLALAVVVAVTASMGRLAVRLGQPMVIGELLGGLFLGSTVLGTIPGGFAKHIIANDIRPGLFQIGNVGVVLYLFLTGLTFNHREIGVRNKQYVSVAAGALLLPIALAVPLAFVLYPFHHLVGHHSVTQLSFALFITTALCVTALPVLARILADRNIEHTRVGALALGAAAIQDIFGWFMLGLCLASIAAGGFQYIPRRMAACMGLLLLIAYVARPLVKRVLSDKVRSPNTATAWSLVGMALCASATSAVGLDAVIGAFIFGAMLGSEWRGSEVVRVNLEPTVLRLMLPVYYLSAGISFDLGKLAPSAAWELPAILLVAFVGKLCGTLLGAALGGVDRQQAKSLAAMMNTRGLIELVVLKAGLTAGVLDQELYTVLVIMALVTTMSASPLLTWFEYRARGRVKDAHIATSMEIAG